LYLHRLATRLIVFDRGQARIFEGTYQEFLDKVGWESEEKEEKPFTVGRSALAAKTKLDDKKSTKLKKATLVQEKSQALKPLETEIARLEKNIAALEKELHHCTESLVQASGEGNGAVIAEMSKKSHRLRPEIEDHYRRLDKVLAEYEDKVKEYKDKMTDLG
jgi:ATP-binding cassette subfamily F protein 3